MGGGGVLNKFVLLEVQPLTPLYTIFHEKGTPFIYLPLTNGTPFTYLAWKFASLLTAVDEPSFKQETITNIERFLNFTKPSNSFVNPVTDPNERFPYPFVYFNERNPYRFIYLKPEKGTPFLAEPPLIGHDREYPPPPSPTPVLVIY